MKNLQGDVVALLDSTGAVVVAYKYDAWGRPIKKEGSLAATLGTVQPFRYRGYVYDEETGLYYLRSRYYDPYHVRFINADAILANCNLYTYCHNEPITRIDSDGTDDSLSESKREVCNFAREGFWMVAAHQPLEYFPDWRRPKQKSIYLMYIPHEHFEFYLRSLTYQTAPDDVLLTALQDEIESKAQDGISELLSLIAEEGKYFGLLLSLYGVAVDKIAQIEKQRTTDMMWDADALAYQNQTGVYVLIEVQRNWGFLHTFTRSGSYVEMDPTITVNYYEKTVFESTYMSK